MLHVLARLKRTAKVQSVLCETFFEISWHNVTFYNPPINFCGLSLDKTDHVIQNRTMVTRGYLPTDLISVI